MALSCFHAAKAYAKDLSLVYLSPRGSGDLWNGVISSVKPCPNTDCPNDSKCLPCFGSDLLHLVCKNLTDPEHLRVEGSGETINLVEGVCPVLLDRGVDTIPQNKDWWLWLLLAVFACAILILGIIYIIYLIYRAISNKLRRTSDVCHP